MSKWVFFLGGRDLEMCEIAKLLKENGIEYHFNGDKWGVKLSAYSDAVEVVLKAGGKIATVELPDDMGVENVTEIDHHGDKSDRPASILQVCDLIGVEPTPWHKLVAINDSRYTKGLLEEGASLEEILAIRDADREAQCITEDQELEAKRAFENGYNVGTLEIYNTTDDQGAPLTDYRMRETEFRRENLVIFSKSENGKIETNYYGPAPVVRALISKFWDERFTEEEKEELEKSWKKHWAGGDVDGPDSANAFFGVGDNIPQEEILEYLKEIAKDQPVYSMLQKREADIEAQGITKEQKLEAVER